MNNRELREWTGQAIRIRCDPSPAPLHPAYRLYPERWLEHSLCKNIRRVRSDLSPHWAYRQVPAYRGSGRGILDMLILSRSNRLVVVEIKAAESQTLLFQALDYWERVWFGLRTGAFHQAGYFSGESLSEEFPEIILVTPVFEWHKNLLILKNYLPASIPITLLEVNLRWRRELKFVRRSALK